MAKYVGNDGIIKVAPSGGTPAQIAQVTAFNLTETANTTRCDSMGDSHEEHVTTKRSFSGSFTLRKDSLLTPQQDLRAGAEIDFEFYFQGETSGQEVVSGSFIVTSRGSDAPMEDVVMLSVDFQGTGAPTFGVIV